MLQEESRPSEHNHQTGNPPSRPPSAASSSSCPRTPAANAARRHTADSGVFTPPDVDTTMAPGDIGSTTLPERTLVEEDREEDAKHTWAKQSEESTSATNSTTPWDPLHTADRVLEAREKERESRSSVDVVDASGKVMFPPENNNRGGTPALGARSGAPPKRASHLRVEVGKAATLPPWEQIDPPADNNLKSLAGYYSPGDTAHTGKFGAMQRSGVSRSLIPKSAYYFGPPPPDSAYGTAPTGQIGLHHPREVLRIERDYTGGEVVQFAAIYPLELEGRITPTRFLESINDINEILISAHSTRHAFVDNMVTILSLQTTRLFMRTHFDKEMKRLEKLIDDLNENQYHPVGLHIRWPQDVAFLFLEIEYY